MVTIRTKHVAPYFLSLTDYRPHVSKQFEIVFFEADFEPFICIARRILKIREGFINMAALLSFGGHGNSNAFPFYFNPNIFFQSTPDDPTPAIPTKNKGVYILASVRNTGTSPAFLATVQFWVCDPSTVPTPVNSQHIGTSNVFLNAGETKTVLCVTQWIPNWKNNGHQCVICEISATNDPSPSHPTTKWNIQDRHVAQHNVDIRASFNFSIPTLFPMAAVGLHNETLTKVTIRPAPDELFIPVLAKFGMRDRSNATKASTSGLVPNYVPGAPLPGKDTLKPTLEFHELRPNSEQEFLALVHLPEQNFADSAAVFLVEQHDTNGKLVGGVAVILLAGNPLVVPAVPTTPAIPASIPYRPYATSITTKFMNPDGIFVTNLGKQHINVETTNMGNQTLTGLSIYVEGIADPNVTSPVYVASPSNGEALASASFKSVFVADFTNATAGETVVSFIVQQQSGSSSKSIRILKKIFVMRIDFDPTTKNFLVKIPHGTLQIHINTIVAPLKVPCRRDCCCGCDGGPGGAIPYPVLIKKGWLNWIPNPTYPGTHGPLPFNDPWWKLLLAIIALILAIAGSIVDGLNGGGDSSAGPTGTFDETDPSVHCCDGAAANAETNDEVAATLFGLAAAAATIAAESDDADLFDRGRVQTPPNPGELTVGELVHFDITQMDSPSPGTKFGGTIKWDYARTVNNGRTLTYSTNNPFSNIHFLKSYQVNIDGKHDPSNLYTHQRKDRLIVAAQFVKPNGSLYKGSQLYVFALLFSDTGTKMGIELRDDGAGCGGGFNPQPDPPAEILNPANSAVVRREITVDDETLTTVDQHRTPNVGTYCGVVSDITRGKRGIWYVFVFAQDVNTVAEGTNPRKAAQTIGGMLLTNQFILGLNGKPCELNYDAIVTVV